MRILVASAWAPRLDNGDGLILHHHLRELSTRHEITVIVAQPERADDSAIEGVRLIRFPPAASTSLDYAKRRAQALTSGEPAHVHWVARAAFVASLHDELAALRPDVVHLFGWGTAQLAELTDRPTTYFSIDPWSRASGNRILPAMRRLTDLGEQSAIRRHERRHLPQVGVVCLVNGAEVDVMRTQIPDARFAAVPLGVEVPDERSTTTEPIIAFHGAMDVEANRAAAVDLVKQVLPRIRRSVPDARVLLIGRDPVIEVRALTGDHVDVVGSVASMTEALRAAAIEIAAMSVGTGMKNKVLEAMAVGLPVVTTASGISGIGAGPGVLVADDFDGLALHATELLLDAALRARMGSDARERVRKDFSWSASARRLEALWEELIS